jgi:hypothetical protein
MVIFGAIVLIICGGLCMPSIIIKKRPEAKDIIDKITPYQGIIGLIICIIGIIWTIFWLFRVGYIAYGFGGFIIWILNLGANVLNALVGFLLGFGMIQNMILKNASADAQAKAEEVHKKLVDIQIPLGFAAIIVGLCVIVFSIIFRMF